MSEALYGCRVFLNPYVPRNTIIIGPSDKDQLDTINGYLTSLAERIAALEADLRDAQAAIREADGLIGGKPEHPTLWGNRHTEAIRNAKEAKP